MSACHQLWSHRAIGRSGNLFVGVLMLIGGVFLIYQGVPGFMAGILITAAVGVLVLDYLRERIWHRYYQSLEIYRVQVTAVFDEHGVSLGANEQWRWNQFQNYVLAKDFIILNVDSRQFVPLPISAMQEAGNRAGVEELVKAKTKRLRGRLI